MQKKTCPDVWRDLTRNPRATQLKVLACFSSKRADLTINGSKKPTTPDHIQGNYYLWVLLVVYVVVGGDEILSHKVSRVVLGTVPADSVLVLRDERFKSGLDVPDELDSGVLELALKVLGTVEPDSGLKTL